MANEKPATQFYALRITLYAQLTTRNPQPDFGANAPPTCHFYALRITLHAQPTTRNAQPATNFGANAPPTRQFHALRITLLLVPRPSPLVPFRDVIFVTVNSKMAKMAGK